MSETSKTVAFVLAAVASLGVAAALKPRSAEFDVTTRIGKELTPAFAPEAAKRMTITTFDEETATLREFEVAEKDGVWSIPSKGGYPADAERQMAEAATGVMDREVLNVVSESAADHDQYGVVDPKSPKLEAGQTGVGTRVTLEGEGDKPLVDIVIGKPVKEASGQHYVRRQNQDVVYVVEIDPEKFSTNFEDWIESDLLKVNAWDIQTVRINDYTAELFMDSQGLGVDANYKTDMTLRYDDAEGKWSPVTLKEATDPRRAEYKDFELAEGQQLDEAKLSDLKSALDDLRIVDVRPKPEGLSANLKAGADFLKDQTALLSLIQLGFAPVGRSAGGEAEILSSEGEVEVTMKDGVQYVLRFGGLQLASDGGEKKPDAAAEGQAAGDATGPGAEGAEGDAKPKDSVNRYLFVMARFDEGAIPRPELEDLPELPEGAEDPKGDEDSEASDEDGATKDAGPESGDDEDADAAADDEDEDGEDDPIQQAIAKRKEVERQNQIKLDEYEAKLKQGRDRVKELNDRFGDWYYVIANDVYKKVHQGRDDLITTKDDKADGKPGEGEGGEFGAPGTAVPGLPSVATDPDPASGAADDAPTADPAEAPAGEPTDAEAGSEADAPAPADAATPTAP